MPQAPKLPARKPLLAKTKLLSSRRVSDALTIAAERGLLSGSRNLTVRGRMPSALVQEAKEKTGIRSDSKLIEAALANIVAADDYGAWLLAHQGSIPRDLDLDF